MRKYDRDELFDELQEMITYFTERESEIKNQHRIKSLKSCLLKYEKFYPTREVEKVFNDVLGIRIIVDDYSVLDQIELPECTKVADMRDGKAFDDGYRGIHLYYQKSHYYYPIEIQFMTSKDRQFNEWLHIFLYKYMEDDSVGARLRTLYDTGIIRTEEDFRKEMKRICAT